MSEKGQRNVTVDLARALAILVVVWFHLSFFRISLAPGDGTGLPGLADLTLSMRGLGPVGWIGSWFLQIMPLFFVAGGFANTLVVDRYAREGHRYGHYLARRAGRLVGPLGLYLGFCTVVGTILAWAGSVAVGVAVTELATRVLWFLAIYLVIILPAPAMVRAHDRWGIAVPALLLAGALLVDAASFATGNLELRELNLLLVWPFAHQLGIAYARGWLRHQPEGLSWLTLAGAALAIVALLAVAPYPTTAVGLGDQMVSNLAPPSTPMALLALAQFALLALVERHVGDRLRRSARLQRVLGVANATAVTTYLWHLPIIALSVGILLVLTLVAGRPVEMLLTTPFIYLVAVPLLVLLIPRIGRVEQALSPPVGSRVSTGLVLTGMLVLMAGLELLRANGMVLHPGAPWSSAGVLLFVAGATVVAKGSNLTGVRGRGRQGHDESVLPGGRA